MKVRVELQDIRDLLSVVTDLEQQSDNPWNSITTPDCFVNLAHVSCYPEEYQTNDQD